MPPVNQPLELHHRLQVTFTANRPHDHYLKIALRRREFMTKKADTRTETDATIAASAVVELAGTSDRNLRHVAAMGYFDPPVRGRYRADQVLPGLLRYYRDQVAKRTGTHAAERVRLLTVRREKLQIERDIQRGLYLPRAEIGPALSNLLANQRQALMRSLADELPGRIAYKTPPQIRAILADTMDHICDLFQSSTRKWLDDAPTQPAEKTEAK